MRETLHMHTHRCTHTQQPLDITHTTSQSCSICIHQHATTSPWNWTIAHASTHVHDACSHNNTVSVLHGCIFRGEKKEPPPIHATDCSFCSKNKFVPPTAVNCLCVFTASKVKDVCSLRQRWRIVIGERIFIHFVISEYRRPVEKGCILGVWGRS